MACRYGTIPVVRKTGGLKDSIIDCGNGDSGIGFVFDNYNSEEMLVAIERALELYRDEKSKWQGLVSRAITTDFSWNKSGSVYLDFYREILAK
jgi:starch synthase